MKSMRVELKKRITKRGNLFPTSKVYSIREDRQNIGTSSNLSAC